MKKRLNEKNILKLIVLLPIVAIILTAIILTKIFINTEKESLEYEIAQLKAQHISEIKTRIKNRVNRVIDIINIQHAISLEKSKVQLKDAVYMGYNVMESLYQEYKAMNKTVIVEEMKHNLKKIRFFANQSGYFFISDMQGYNLMHPLYPALEGQNLLKSEDKNAKDITEKILFNLKTKNESFSTWVWPRNGIPGKKLAFYKKFEPLDIYIGTAMYFDDIHTKNLQDSLTLLNAIIYEDNNYIFAVNNDGVTVAHYNKKFVNLPLNKMSPKGQKVIQGILGKREEKEESFIEYKTMSIGNENRTYKISFVKYVPHLELTIGTGFHTKQLNETIQQKTEMLTAKLKDTTNKIIMSSFLVTLVLIFLLLFVANALKNILNTYAQKLAQNNNELKELNSSLEKKIATEVAKNRKQDDILNQQAKMAAMGEMLANISHQWRQPLTAISTGASGIKLQDELNLLTKEDMYQTLDRIVKNTQMLSETIDDFRNFFNPKKTIETFNIQDSLKKVFVLMHANLKNAEIEVIQHIPQVELHSHQNELIQAILNILNNSKDALIGIKEKQRYLFVSVVDEKEEIILTIKDNANGIEEKIINRVFEPYFTTKHQAHGTGIGLYMTQKIIEGSLKGSIKITNETFIYENTEYTGALCTIRLPKNL